MSTQKIIFIFAILIAGLSSAQTNTSKNFKDNSFKLSDTNVVSGQYYRIFDLSFNGADTLKSVNSDARLDSLINYINNHKITNIMVSYVHYSDKGSLDNYCIKQSWDKAVAITKYMRKKLVYSKAFSKTLCYKPEIRAKIKVSPKTKNSDEFAQIVIINR
ncbi:MAG: hypothetical protein JSU07_01795 [Bacteroidetes bacterium]|nr:hypothetical protein [Bacteroidota bacterium]